MKFPRSSGILLHPTSLPGPFGIGDLGAQAYQFADFLHNAGQSLWQVLPLGPTGYGDSPYQCFSAFAGNPLLISPQKLVERGYLMQSDLEASPLFTDDEVDYGRVIQFKRPLLQRAFHRFQADRSASDRQDFEVFRRQNTWWLDDFALFMALKESHGAEAIWSRWEPEIATRHPAAMARWSEKLTEQIHAWQFWQFEFFRQWGELKQYCHDRGIRIMGDLPIYVAHDSADVWAHLEMFQLDERGDPTVVAGVPPDYFSASGQLWGNPIYRWDVLAESGFDWWIRRLRAMLEMFDIVRLDHFRGFEAYWEVPARAATAVAGRWIPGPGAALFEAIRRALGELPIVAENLGVITPEVEAIRQQFGFPGMAVLQFAFGKDPQAHDFRPHNHLRELVAYTGTHDNDTIVGWWTSSGTDDSTRTPEDIQNERDFASRYLGTSGSEIHWVFIRALLASVADTVLVPLQDALGLGSEARMNLPARPSGNWRWRFSSEMLRPELSKRLKELTILYERHGAA